MYTRLLTEQDVAGYRQLRLQSYQTDPLAFSESYEDEIQKPESDFSDELKTNGTPPESFVLGLFTTDDTLAGFVKFRRDIRSKARHKAMIHAMYIAPDVRGQGSGKKLMDDLLSIVKKLQGLEQLHLWVLHAQTSAAGYYLKCGFKSQGTRVKNDLKINGIYVDAEYFVMYLNE